VITEGPLKDDAAVSAGLHTVGVTGVYNWKTKNDAGGTVVLPCFEHLALRGRLVAIAFDSDSADNPDVYKAMERLGAVLAQRGASVSYARIPPAADGGKQGLDDWLVTGGNAEAFWELCWPELPPAPTPALYPPEIGATAQPLPCEPPNLASEQDILGRFAVAVASCGLVGERDSAALLYLAITSRLLDSPVSVGVKGHSASGKSYTVKTVTRFFPPSAVFELTGMSEKALVYSAEDFKHRHLVLYEADALREGDNEDHTAYYVRSLLSEGQIRYDVTIRDPKDGGFTTRHIEKDGPTGLIFTTTKAHIHAENETRSLSITSDDSTRQTEEVLRSLADETEYNVDLTEWQQLQEWLYRDGERRVTIPFASVLAGLVPPAAVRLRRDFGAVLALTRSSAILHQQTRQRDAAGRIVASIDDYAKVLEVAGPLVSQGIGAGVIGTIRETVGAVGALQGEHAEGATALAVSKHLGIDKSNAGRRLTVAAAAGYVVNLEDRRGKPGRWVTDEQLPNDKGVLPTIAGLVRAVETGTGGTATAETDESAGQSTSDTSGCAVAPISGGDTGETVIRVGGSRGTCALCRTDMVVTEPGQTMHPLCAIKSVRASDTF
jgi:hypothetical protein